MIILIALFNQAPPISLNGEWKFSNILKHKVLASMFRRISNAVNKKVCKKINTYPQFTVAFKIFFYNEEVLV